MKLDNKDTLIRQAIYAAIMFLMALDIVFVNMYYDNNTLNQYKAERIAEVVNLEKPRWWNDTDKNRSPMLNLPYDTLPIPEVEVPEVDISGLETEVIDRSFMTEDDTQEPILSVNDIHSMVKKTTKSISENNLQVVDIEELLGNEVPDVKPTFQEEMDSITSEELIYSSIEDDMIYTLTKVDFDTGTSGTVLYINNPDTQELVACSIMHSTEDGEITNLYNFN